MSICVGFGKIKLPPLFAFRVPMGEFGNVFVIQVDEERRRIQSDKKRRPELKARCMMASSDLHPYLPQLTWDTIRHPFSTVAWIKSSMKRLSWAFMLDLPPKSGFILGSAIL